MFNLETAIAAWRRSLEFRRVFLDDDLEELESHVRAQVEGLVREGLTEEAAFRQTIREMGDYFTAEGEYRKVYWGKLRRQRRLRDEILWRLTMLKSYFKTAIRNFWRQKAYSFINVLGLSVGLASSFLILLWIQNERRYDRFHEQGDQLHRVMRNVHYSDGQIATGSSVPMPLADVLETEYPEISHAVLVSWETELVFSVEDQTFRERGRYATPGLFEIFSFSLIQGTPRKVLENPDAVVISESLARKYFGPNGSTDALGRRLYIDRDYTITGVFEDIPENSSLRFDFVLPGASFFQQNDWVHHWGNSGFRIFVRLQEGADGAALSRKIENVINDHHPSANSKLFLQPYTDMYLHSNFEDGQLAGGRIEYVRIFALVAVFLLLIASINFMNLVTARSAGRAREIGVRKTVGATQGSLAGQFIGESVLMALGAFVVAVGVVAALLPAFNDLTGKPLTAGSLDPGTLLLFLGIAVLTGILAGSYPALYLSSFTPTGALRNTFRHWRGSINLRKGLVVFQFALSVLLLIGTVTVYNQLAYIRGKNLGLDRQNVLYFSLEGPMQQQFDVFKQELMQRPGIADVTSSSENPLSVSQSTGDPTWDGKDPESQIRFRIITANYDFVETMKMEMLAGRTFSRAFGTDSVSYIVNEQMAKVMGVDNPVDEHLAFWGDEGPIIGLVKDFHITSLYVAIEPVIIRLEPEQTWQVFVRTKAGQAAAALASLERVHQQFNPGYPFDYRFLDERFEETYENEIVIGRLAKIFAFLAVFIACLGLFGLASFAAEQRTKEIGIRKVLGASVSNLVLLLSRDFVKLVLAAFVLAAPIAYFVMQRWLNDFAYRIEISWLIFLGAGLAVLGIAWLTVSYQSVKAALADPVKSLRYE